MFLLKFLALFGLFYFGTLAVIGLAAPGKFYSPFIEHYLDYVSWIKQSLIWGVGRLASVFGYETVQQAGFVIRVKSGAAVLIAMDCVGYGVYSFWAAYVMANEGSLKRKTSWVMVGLVLLWLINVIRITAVLIALQKGKAMPLGIDHHTWFNIIAYCFIFLMIWRYERGGKNLKIQKSGDLKI